MNNTHSFSEQKHNIIQDCVDYTSLLLEDIFTNSGTQATLKEKFNALNEVDLQSPQLKNEIKDYLFGVRGQSAGLFKMFARAKGFDSLYQIINDKKKRCPDTPSGIIKSHILESIESKFMQHELKLSDNANESWQNQLRAIRRNF